LLNKEEEFCTQYSGVDNEGKFVMGVLKCNHKNKQIEIDSIFKWDVNSEWTLQEAAKLPLSYSMVHVCSYLLFMKFIFNLKNITGLLLFGYQSLC